MYVSGDFPDRAATIKAIEELRANGLGPADLDVYSDRPLEIPRDVLARRSHMSFVVVTGAITALLLTIGFVYFTQHNYPIVTGGMPLFSGWATGVVFYELTMLGAIVTTFCWFLKESGLPKLRRRTPTPPFEPGSISVRVHCRPEQRDAVRRMLESAGAGNFRVLSEAQ
jgi:Protein of unknown function (DUF3341)